MRTSVALLASFLATLAAAHDARALSCEPVPTIAFWPLPESFAPVNTHVSLELADRERATKPACAELALFAAPTATAGSPSAVPVGCREANVALAMPITRVELTPLSPLVAMARYEVRAGARVVATFSTGGVNDTTPPRWLGVAKARHVAAPAISLGGTGATIAIELQDLATDDLDVVDEVRYAIWIQRGPGAIDYAAMPTLVERAPAARPPVIEIGEVGCDPHGLSVDRPRPITRVGVRAIDRAGNRTAPSEASVVRK